MSRHAALALVALTAACTDYGLDLYEVKPEAGSDTDTATAATTTSTPDAPTSTPADTTTSTDGVVPEPPADDCDNPSDLIYVVDRAEEKLYLFDPTTLTYTSVGKLACGAGTATPGSMAVSRDGFAYVRYSNNKIYAVDLLTLDCTKTAYGEAAFGDFGMGFSTDSADTWEETLYLANDRDVASVDLATWGLSPSGSVASQPELTGDANGELWAFLPLEKPAALVQLDKGGGPDLQTLALPGFPKATDIDTFAFATWGGDFWLFVREYGMGNTTDVYQVTPDGTLTLAKRDSGRDVVGAGVSTCAPAE